MPQRTKVDARAILGAYKRLKNAFAVAEKFGLHANTIYQVLRRFRGKCRDCSNEIGAGEIYCKACKKLHADRRRERRKIARRNGICVECRRRRDPLSRQYCTKHRLAHLKRSAESRSKTKRGTPRQSISPEYRRIGHLKYKYGEHAVRRWTECGGKCQLCGTSNNEVSIQLHHIDCDEKNHSYENLTCLCFKCHRALHQILSVRQPRKLLAYIDAVYGSRLLNYPD